MNTKEGGFDYSPMANFMKKESEAFSF